MNQYAFINEYYSLTDRKSKIRSVFHSAASRFVYGTMELQQISQRVLDPAIGNNIFLDNIEEKMRIFRLWR